MSHIPLSDTHLIDNKNHNDFFHHHQNQEVNLNYHHYNSDIISSEKESLADYHHHPKKLQKFGENSQNFDKFGNESNEKSKEFSRRKSSHFFFHLFLPTLIKANLINPRLIKEKSKINESADFREFLQRRLLVMRLKERIVILLIGICCVLCVLFVFQAKIVDDSAWEYPKKFK